MFINTYLDFHKEQVPKKESRKKDWEPFRNKKLLTISVLLVVLVLLLVWLWPLLCRLIPPTKHEGVQLYESGQYLEYDKGPLFEKQVFQLPFAENAEVESFVYYDFWARDAVLKHDPFADAYILQLDLGEDYGEAKQYLEDRADDVIRSQEDKYHIYYLAGVEKDDFFFVSLNDQTREVYCFLVTDITSWSAVDSYFYMNIGSLPGE